MKRLQRICPVLAAVSLAAVAACSGGGGAGGDSDTNAEGEIVIDFWHGYGGSRMHWVDQAVERYNKMTDGVEVRTESKTDYEKLFDSVLLSAETDAAPELAQVVVTYTASALDSGAFKTISEADTEGKIDPADYMPAVTEQLTVDGELTSVPWAHSGPVLFYDKGVFEKAGLDPEDPPQTWTELQAACEAIVDEKKITENCIGIPWDPWLIENWMAGQDEPLLDNENGRGGEATTTMLESDAARTTFENWKTLYDEKFYPYSPEGYDFPRQMFSEGKTAMTISSIADAAYFEDTLSKQDRELGTGYLPSMTPEPSIGTTLGGASVWLTAGQSTEVEQASLDFLKWLSSPKMAAEWHKVTGYFPVNTDAEPILAKEGWFDEHPWSRTAIDQLDDTKLTAATRGPLHAAMPEVNEAMLSALERALLDDTSIEEALSEASEESDEAISRTNELM